MDDYNFRIAKIEDIDEIYVIEKLCFDSTDVFPKRVFHYYLNDFTSLFLIVETKIKNKIIGFIIVSRKKEAIYEIITLNVHPDWRNKGIGTYLLTQAEEYIIHSIKNKLKPRSSAGNPSIFEFIFELVVLETNKKARMLYEKLGYVFTEIIQNYYGKNRNGVKMVKIVKFWF